MVGQGAILKDYSRLLSMLFDVFLIIQTSNTHSWRSVLLQVSVFGSEVFAAKTRRVQQEMLVRHHHSADKYRHIEVSLIQHGYCPERYFTSPIGVIVSSQLPYNSKKQGPTQKRFDFESQGGALSSVLCFQSLWNPERDLVVFTCSSRKLMNADQRNEESEG